MTPRPAPKRAPAKKIAAKKAAPKRPRAKKAPSPPPSPAIDEEVFATVLAAIESAVEPRIAARAAGVKPEDFDAVMSENEAQRDAVEQAIARCEVRLAVSVRAGMLGWESHRWLLERRFAERWTRIPAPVLIAQARAEAANDSEAEVIEEDELARMRRVREERARDAATRAAKP